MPRVDLAFRLLCDRLAIGAPFLHPAVLADSDTGVGYRHLLDLGLAKPDAKLLDDITCPWCSTGSLHQVCRARGGSGGNAYRGLCLSTRQQVDCQRWPSCRRSRSAPAPFCARPDS